VRRRASLGPMKHKVKPFNSARLTELFPNDDEAVIDLLDAAVASLGDICEGLSRALPAANWPASLSLSHELKGVCSSIGADELAALADALQVDLRNSRSVDSSKYLPRLTSAHQQFLLEARAYQAKATGETPARVKRTRIP
jgi:HPt (histidine-containing phosphotransfer) domain-containing protein